MLNTDMYLSCRSFFFRFCVCLFLFDNLRLYKTDVLVTNRMVFKIFSVPNH